MRTVISCHRPTRRPAVWKTLSSLTTVIENLLFLKFRGVSVTATSGLRLSRTAPILKQRELGVAAYCGKMVKWVIGTAGVINRLGPPSSEAQTPRGCWAGESRQGVNR